MKRYLKYIFLALTAIFMAASCIEEMQFGEPFTQSDELTLVPRVRSFANQYVTKAGYASDETRITSLTVLIFNSEGDLVHLQSVDGNKPVTLNKSMLKISGATVVMFANVSLDQIRNASGNSIAEKPGDVKLSNLDSYIITNNQPIITDLAASDGLPMMGRTDNVDLTPTSEQQAAIEVPLNILYAKVKFAINVAPGTENQGTGSFDLNSFSVFNAATTTNVAAETFATAASTYTAEGTTIPADDLTFYISENRYSHNSDLMGIYPDNGWLTSVPSEDVKDYKSPDDDSRLNGVKYFYDDIIQQYKPKLADKGAGKATYALLSGTYTDYRGTVWDVRYTIYLGKDNAINFHVDRNSEYTNNITIKGIRNNDSYGEDQVWIDHRVNVTDVSGAAEHVTITRETLIDAHIEARPLRIDLNGSDYIAASIYLPKYPLNAAGNIIYDSKTTPTSWGQVQEIAGGNNENWIAIENNNGSATESKLYASNGKRNYFTTSLIEELHLENDEEGTGIHIDEENNRYIPLYDGSCAWIYFDENNTENVRQAQIDVVFYTSSGESITEKFNISQSGLKKVGNQYYIETYEEYLHTYDSDDRYGLGSSPTDYTQQGFGWGFSNHSVSKNNIVSATPLSILGTNIQGLIPSRYDYFHRNDIPEGNSYYWSTNSGGNWVESSNFSNSNGQNFTELASRNESLTIIGMSTVPTNAYEYCLAKNKFNEDPNGDEHTMMLHWYLPDVYELQSVLVAAQGAEDFKADAFYWSSQPSYTTDLDFDLLIDIALINEDKDNARAVSASEVKDFPRSNQNRIRCFYSSKGIEVNMTDRVPDGLGGLIKIPMRAYESYVNSGTYVKGYFFDWLAQINDPIYNTPTPPTYAFPTGADAYTFDTVSDENGTYYLSNPASSGSWDYGNINLFDNTLYYYPGLSKYEVVNGEGLSYRESTTPKQYQRTETIATGQQIKSLPSNSQLANKPLDYLEPVSGDGVLTISFNSGTNSRSPLYQYLREDEVNIYTYTKGWEVPTYEGIPFNQTTGGVVTGVSVGVVEYALLSVGSEYEYNGQTHIVTNKYTTGSIFNRKYYLDLGPRTISQTVYKYKTGTGGWASKEDKTGPVSGTPRNIDRLEVFAGNDFTISAKDGYLIRSIKINFTDSNNIPVSTLIGGGQSNNRYMRLVDNSQPLPIAQNTAPDNMSYSSDGDYGWFKWSVDSGSSGVSSVSLKLATYTVEPSIDIMGINRPSSFQYISPADATGYQSDFEQSIVIDSFEIRAEKVNDTNSN